MHIFANAGVADAAVSYCRVSSPSAVRQKSDGLGTRIKTRGLEDMIAFTATGIFAQSSHAPSSYVSFIQQSILLFRLHVPNSEHVVMLQFLPRDVIRFSSGFADLWFEIRNLPVARPPYGL